LISLQIIFYSKYQAMRMVLLEHNIIRFFLIDYEFEQE